MCTDCIRADDRLAGVQLPCVVFASRRQTVETFRGPTSAGGVLVLREERSIRGRSRSPLTGGDSGHAATSSMELAGFEPATSWVRSLAR